MSLSRKDFERLTQLIYEQVGIKSSPAKRTMLEGRLTKRMRALGKDSISAYCSYLFSDEGTAKELVHLIDVVTTNKTDFFREPAHFEYLTKQALPALGYHPLGEAERPVAIWSAGCSSGEEPFTLAMALHEYRQAVPDFRYRILATDISTRVLKMAQRAIYQEDRVTPVPMALRKRYLLRSKNRAEGLVRIVPELRRTVRFGRLNFMEDEFNLETIQDVIFCRNVMIYFDRPTQEALLQKFCRWLSPGGYLFLGHSESIHGMDLPLVQVAPTVYHKAV